LLATKLPIYNAAGNGCNNIGFIANAPVTIVTNGMDVTVPLSKTNQRAAGPATPGAWNFKVTTQFNVGTGQFSAITDRMPDTGLAPASTAAPSACAMYPTGFVPFTSITYVATDTAGDTFVVGIPTQGIISELQFISLPSAINQQFCSPVVLETNFMVRAYVPTVGERGGDFSGTLV